MKSPRRQKRLHPNTLQLIRQIVGGLLVLMLVALLVFSVRYISHLPALTIQEVRVSGGETISHELVKTLVEAELEGDYLRFIPRRFSWLYPEQKIIDSVHNIDRIKEIHLERTVLTELSLTFSEYVPDALWCDEKVSQCVFIDDTGFAFAKAPSLTGGSFLRLGKLDVTPVTNVQAFEQTAYTQVRTLVSLLEESNWFVEKVAVDVAGDAYLHLVEGGELKVVLADPPERIIGNLFTVLNSSEFSDIGPGNFEYIDLRFGNKVFVNERELEMATTTEMEMTIGE